MEPSDYKPMHPEVHDYVDGKLTADEERKFERRMDRDEELSAQVGNLQNALAMLDSVREYELPSDFNERIVGRCHEADLVERARSQIKPALSPFWQPLVHVAMGAVAAAIVVAVIGLPTSPPEKVDVQGRNITPPLESVAAFATEEDLLPALGDQFNRYENLRRQVSFVRVDDPAMQREIIRVELELSEIQRRNFWLRREVGGLPDARRIEYIRFLDSLNDALSAIDSELVEALNQQRAPRKEVINGALAGVEIPARLRLECPYILRRTGTGTNDELGSSKIGIGIGHPQVRSYTRIREALYRHDYSTMHDAANRYLAEFPQGKFVDAASLYVIIALLRENKDERAASKYLDFFGEYEADMTRDQAKLKIGLLTAEEYSRLKTAKRKLSE